MKRTIGIISMMLIISVGFAFAAGSQQGRAQDGTTELTVALWHYTTQPEFERTLNAYSARNPNVRFDIIDTLTSNFVEVITTQLAGGRAIDVLFVLNVPFHAQMIQSRQLRDLTDRIAAMPGAQNMRGSLDGVRATDNRTYAVPWRQDFWPLYYNRDLFDAAGEPYPENLTWDQYRDLAARLTRGSGATKVSGSHLHTWNSITQCLSAVQLQQNLITDDFGFLRYMYQIRTAMQNAGSIMDYGTIVAGNVGYRPRFENQLAAMMIMGSWYIGELADRATFNWGIAPVPQMPGSTGGIRTMGNPTPIGIPTGARNVEEAWRFIEFATGEAGALILAELGIPSAFKNDRVNNTFFNLPGMPTDPLSRRAFNPDFVYTEWPMNPLSGAVDSILNQEHQLILVGEATIDDGIRRMGERAAREIR